MPRLKNSVTPERFRLSILLAIGALFLLPPSLARSDLAPGEPATRTINELISYYEVQGCACADFVSIASQPSLPWSVLEIDPDPQSGFYATDSRYPGVGTCNDSGKYLVLASLGVSQLSHSGSYLWPALAQDRSQPYFNQGLSNIVFQSFANMQPGARTIVALVNSQVTGRDVFSDVTRIPNAWQGYIQPAIAYLRNAPRITEANTTNPPVGELRAAMDNDNPIVVIAATQLLAKSNDVTIADLQTVESSQDSDRIACVISILVYDGWLKNELNTELLEHEIKTTPSLATLSGIANGLNVGRDVASGFLCTCNVPSSVQHFALKDEPTYQELIGDVRTRLNQLLPHGSSSNPQWAAIDNSCQHFFE